MGKHTPRDEQLAWVSAWRESGESMRRFAARHGLRVQTFRAWVRTQRETELRAEFLEVQLSAVTVAPRTGFAVRVGGLAFVFDEPPPPDWFAAVLRGAGRC
jgi:transposase-like protein